MVSAMAVCVTMALIMGVDGDDRPGQFKRLQQQGNGRDPIGFDVCRVLAKDQTLPGRSGRHHVQGEVARFV